MKWTERLRNDSRRFRHEFAVYRLVMRHPRTPRASRLLLGAALAYALSPVDLIPDFIPVIGHLDDLLVVPLLVWLALRLIPRDVIDECRRQASEPHA